MQDALTHPGAFPQALNDQINVEYTASYAYHSLFAYFDRDTVALPGFAKFMEAQSLEVGPSRRWPCTRRTPELHLLQPDLHVFWAYSNDFMASVPTVFARCMCDQGWGTEKRERQGGRDR